MDEATVEKWLDIEEFKGLYQVSNLGRVRSVERHINTRTYPSVIMKQYPHYNGKQVAGMRVHLRDPNKAGQIQRSVGKLVLWTFRGKPPKLAKQIIHIDGDATNNTLTNLRWDVDKSYYLPINETARELFNKYAYAFIKSYIRKKDLYNIKFGYMDKDDFTQECALAIWNVIDCYDETHCTFMRFVFIKCEWFFKKLYKKYARRREIAPTMNIESEMVMDDLPIDYIKELSYEGHFYGD